MWFLYVVESLELSEYLLDKQMGERQSQELVSAGALEMGRDRGQVLGTEHNVCF